MGTSDGWQNRIVGEGMVAAGELVAHPQNWRKHPAGQAGLLNRTLGGVGWVQRVIVNRRTGHMLDGHLRAELARKQGAETPVPVVYVDLSEDEERAVLATLDPIAGMAVADEATLAALVRSIDDADLRSVAGDLAQVLNVAVDGQAEPVDAEAQVDRAEELRVKWGVEPGQMWQLGEHRLICGDCTDAAVVARVMSGEKADCVVTDPPYAFGLSSTANEGSKAGGWHDMMNNATWFADRLRQWRDVAPGALWWMFCNWRTLPIVMKAGSDAKESIVSVMIWNKDWIGPGGTRGLRPAYEMVALFANGEASIEDRGQPDIVTVGWSSHKPTGHAAEKPVELLSKLVGLTGGAVVFEPFSGSGTTLIACENLGRRCRAVEIAPGYVAVALERWATATGGTPVLVANE